jgi:hypothetical protein
MRNRRFYRKEIPSRIHRLETGAFNEFLARANSDHGGPHLTRLVSLAPDATADRFRRRKRPASGSSSNWQ